MEAALRTVNAAPQKWRVWVDNQNKIVSFHPAGNSRLLEFRSYDLFLRFIDQYTGQSYRYQ